MPIVNLWMPYVAVRDCLPPEHPHRPRVLHWWIALLLAGFLSVAAGASALFSTGAALVLSIPAALACLAVIAWAPGIVLAIAASHQEALATQTAGNRGVARLSHERAESPAASQPERASTSNLRTVHLGIALLLLGVHLASLRSW